MKDKKIYIAGPMQGYPEFNFPAFFEAQGYLERLGWIVFNPAAKDLEKHPDIQNNSTGDIKEASEKGFDLRVALTWDMSRICESDGIYLLRGWEHSHGASAEWALAVALQKTYKDFRIIYQ